MISNMVFPVRKRPSTPLDRVSNVMFVGRNSAKLVNKSAAGSNVASLLSKSHLHLDKQPLTPTTGQSTTNVQHSTPNIDLMTPEVNPYRRQNQKIFFNFDLIVDGKR